MQADCEYTPTAISSSATGSLREEVLAFERGVVERALEACAGNPSEAARRLGVSRMTLIEKMKRHGLFRR